MNEAEKIINEADDCYSSSASYYILCTAVERLVAERDALKTALETINANAGRAEIVYSTSRDALKGKT